MKLSRDENTIPRIRPVSIPRSGLRTRAYRNIVFASLPLSPSHTVGLEPVKQFYSIVKEVESPSHTVGLEHMPAKVGAEKIVNIPSPSHTVGLKRQGGVSHG